GLFLRFPNRFLDGPAASAPSIRQDYLRLPPAGGRSALFDKSLRLKSVDRLGDGRRTHAQPLRKTSGRLPVLAGKRQHDLVLPGIETVGQKPCRKGGARQPRGRMQPVHGGGPVSLRHAFLLQDGATIAAPSTLTTELPCG